jgi:phosphate starvation-inducible membrane PsiE
MDGTYFKINHIPVRFMIYEEITTLTRMFIEIVSDTKSPHEEILLVVSSIVLFSLAVLILRFGSYQYRSGLEGYEEDDVDEKNKLRE